MARTKAAANAQHYLEENRLQNVIAAITVMGLHEEYRQSASSWVYGLTGIRANDQPPNLTERWRSIFKQHSEFFREASANKDHFALIIRRALAKDGGARPPVSDNVLKLLIDTAISIHGKQFSQRADERWGVALLMPFLGGFLAAVLGFLAALLK